LFHSNFPRTAGLSSKRKNSEMYSTEPSGWMIDDANRFRSSQQRVAAVDRPPCDTWISGSSSSKTHGILFPILVSRGKRVVNQFNDQSDSFQAESIVDRLGVRQ
jgi:hypothetical protein